MLVASLRRVRVQRVTLARIQLDSVGVCVTLAHRYSSCVDCALHVQCSACSYGRRHVVHSSAAVSAHSR